MDQADALVPPAPLHRGRAAAVQLRRRPDRPAGAAVWLPAAAQLLGDQRLLDPPAQPARRPSQPRRARAAPPPPPPFGPPPPARTAPRPPASGGGRGPAPTGRRPRPHPP